MDQLEKLIERLNSIAICLSSLQDSISSISMSDFYKEKSIDLLFLPLIQDISLYQDFDWSSIDAKVIKSDRFGVTAILCKGNVFKREIIYPSDSQFLEVRYLSCHKDKSELIIFKDTQINEMEPVEIAKLPSHVALKMLKDSLSAKELKILIKKVNEEITEAEREYDLNQAAELKYGVLSDLEERLKVSGKRQKNK